MQINLSIQTDESLHSRLKYYSDSLAFYYVLPVALIGVVSNVSIILVMRRLRMSRAVRLYYSALAAFDCTLLLAYHVMVELLHNGLRFIGVPVHFRLDQWQSSCKLLVFLAFFSEGCVGLLTTLLAFDRFVRVCKPFAKLRHGSNQRLLLMIVIASAVLNSAVMFVFDVREHVPNAHCSPKISRTSQLILVVLESVDTTGPGIAIACLNAVILVKLHRKAKQISLRNASRKSTSGPSYSQLESVTLVLWNSVVFVLVYTPTSVSHLMCIGGAGLMCLWNRLLFMLAAIVHCSNFFVCLGCMREFRRFVLTALRGKFHTPHPATDSSSQNYYSANNLSSKSIGLARF